jgi:hypothetical protein
VEKDPRSPGGKGYTGFEALLQYLYDQSMAINAFDANGYMLKVNLFVSECSDYQNVQSLKEKLKKDPGFYGRCAAILGPNQPGITQRDPSHTGAQGTQPKAPAVKRSSPARRPQEPPKAPAAPQAPRPAAPKLPEVPKADDLKGRTKKEIEKARRRAERIKQRLEDTLGIQLPDLPATPALPQVPSTAPTSVDPQELLDFLLAP